MKVQEQKKKWLFSFTMAKWEEDTGTMNEASCNSSKSKPRVLWLRVTDIDSFASKAKSACKLNRDTTVQFDQWGAWGSEC